MSKDDLGLGFEAENEQADLEHWRSASDAERGRVIADLIAYAEAVTRSTGIRNDAPARRIPPQDEWAGTDGGS